MSIGRSRPVVAALVLAGALAGAAVLAGCGSGGGSGLTIPKVAPAKTFDLGHFAPTGTIVAGRKTTLTFTVQLPSGRPLTRYRTGSGPHTGVHLIIVRSDLAYIIHEHPPIAPDGVLRQAVTFPAPGPYRVLVDIYPDLAGQPPNFQLFRNVRVAGAYRPRRLPRFHADEVIDGYHFAMHGHPALHAIQAEFVSVDVTDPQGQPVRFVPWFGALAHAIFFRVGSLDYFHTHICAANAVNCGSLPGVTASRITGRATAPGKLTVGVLLPVGGTWRLFLQLKQHGRIITAPFTLQVAS